VRDAIGVDEGAALEGKTGRASRDIGVAKRKEHVRLDGFFEIDDGGVVLQPGGVVTVLDEAFALADTDFLAAILERESHGGIFGAAAFVDDAGGEKLRKEHAAVGRPVEGVDGVREKGVAAVELVALEQAAALAVDFLEPDVVVLEIVFFGFDVAAGGIDDAAVGSEREGGDFIVDVLEGLVEILRASSRKRTQANEHANQRAEKVEERRSGHGLGWAAV